MNDEDLLRYNRQIMLPQIDIEGQQKLIDAHVVIIGLGGLGSPAALYLASSGVGRLTLVDDDSVEINNLQRQILHGETDIGSLKTSSARNKITEHNSNTEITTIERRIDGRELSSLIEDADVVIDSTDNFESRYVINRACVNSNTPLVSGAAIRFEGQVMVFLNNENHSPCYCCLFPEDTSDPEESCSENGVIAPLVGIIGSMQALECIKIISGSGRVQDGRLMLFDALSSEWRNVQFKKDPSCPVCS